MQQQKQMAILSLFGLKRSKGQGTQGDVNIDQLLILNLAAIIIQQHVRYRRNHRK
jgi:hypothetical protein